MSSIPLPALSIRPPEQPDPLGSFQKLMALKSLGQSQEIQQQTIQSNQQEQQIKQQQIADQVATTAAMKSVDPSDPKYKTNPTQYYEDLQAAALKRGASSTAAIAIQKHGLDTLNTVSTIAKQDAETGSKNLETFIGKHKAIGDQLESLLNLPDDQLHSGAAAAIQNLTQAGVMDQNGAQQASQMIQSTQDPKTLRTMIDTIAKTSMGATNVATLAKTQAEQGEAVARTGEANATADQKRAESAWYTSHPGAGAPGVPAEVQQQAAWLDANPGKTAADYKQHIATLPINTRYSLENGSGVPGAPGSGTPASSAQTAQKFGMTQESFDQAAEKYYTTGQLPPVGRGISGIGLNRALMNRAGDLHPGASLAGNEAAFAANKSSLTKLQTNFDQVSAFENTAGKNLQLFLDKLSAIPDLGVKFANTPLRLIDNKMIGSDNYQAMKAAQQTAASEAAKVLGSANASGVLSDTQKKEAEEILSGNLSYSAAQKVVATLKQDFANRHQSYSDQIADIKNRMSGGGQSNASPAVKDLGPAPQGKAEGSTGALSDGTKVIVKNGRIVAQ